LIRPADIRFVGKQKKENYYSSKKSAETTTRKTSDELTPTAFLRQKNSEKAECEESSG